MQLSLEKIKKTEEGLLILLVRAGDHSIHPDEIKQATDIFVTIQGIKKVALESWSQQVTLFLSQKEMLDASNRAEEASQIVEVIRHMIKQNPYYCH